MKKFDRIYVEISNICNLACSFCPEVERPKKVMKTEDFEVLLKKIKDHTKMITLHLMGEPLLHPNIGVLFDLCFKYDLKVNLTTNGILFKKKLEEFILKNALYQINFSLQSFPDNFPEASFENYLDSILFDVDDIMMRRPDVYINFRLWNQGTSEEEYIKKFIIEKIFNRYMIQVNENVDVGFKKSKNIVNRFYLHFDSRFDWPNLKGPNVGTKGFCHGLKSHIGVHADGSVVPCCLDKESKINLGNLFEAKKLDDIIENERSRKIIEGFQKGDVVEDLCQHCSYRLRFSKDLAPYSTSG